MNQTLKYIAVAAAFASAAFAFASWTTMAGVLAVAAGILVADTIIRKEPK